eukprot:Sspe_Gene.53155::Locus_29407_Transcript_1_1_Confidence_1.000_Length_1348::g.53155::m.53155
MALAASSAIALPMSSVPTFLSPGRAMSAVRRPFASVAWTAFSIARALSGNPSECSIIMAALRMAAMGLAFPCPAMSGAEPWMGSYKPGVPGSPRLAEGRSPREPARTDPSSERMSPKRFSVTTTSIEDGERMMSMATLSTSPWRNSTSGNSFSTTSVATRRHSRLVANTLALSTLSSFRFLPIAARAATRTILSTSGTLYGRVSMATPSAFSSSRFPKYSPPVSSRTKRMLTPLAMSARSGETPSRASKDRMGRRLANSPSSLRIFSSPCSGFPSVGFRLSHFGPPTAPRRIASDFRQALRVKSGRALFPVASKAAPPMRWLSKVKERSFPCTLFITLTACSATSGPTPSPGSTTILLFTAVAYPRTAIQEPRMAICCVYVSCGDQ